MKKNLPLLLKINALALMLMMVPAMLLAQELIAYWNFNTGVNGTPWNAPIPASAGSGSITAGTWTWGDINFTDGFAGNTQNALFGDPAGASLSLRNNTMNGKYIQFEFSMSGFENLIISYWTQKTSTGFISNQWSWSTDGVNFTDFGTVVNPATTPGGVITLELSALNLATTAFLRYTLNGATSATGNNRIDNLQLKATQVGGILPPSNLTASAISTSQIDLAWQRNASSDNVLLAWSSNGNFGMPSGDYQAGDVISGGGTVLYFGNNQAFNHSGLNPNTKYYYKAWSKSGNDYSAGITANATTLRDPVFTTLPYLEAFESDLGDCYPYTVTGIKPWYHFSASAAANGFSGQNPEEQWLILPGINLNNYNDEVMNFTTYAQYGVNNENNYLKLFYSVDYSGTGNPAFATWNELTFIQPEGINNTTEVSAFSGNISLSAISGTSVFIAFKYYSTDNPTRWRVDDINIFEATSPLIAANPTNLSGFAYQVGSGPSSEKVFTVSGSNLTGNISLVPPANFEISALSGVGFAPANPLVLQHTGGTVDATTIYVKLKAGLEVGTYNNELIAVTSAGAATVNVSCSGSVTPVVALPLSISSMSYTYPQDFNTLASSGAGNTWVDNQTLAGWYWQSPGDRDPNVIGYNANDGTSSSANATSFGVADNPDRAMGAISGSSNREYHQAVQFQNNTGNTINLSEIYISFTGEQWRRNTQLQSLVFSYAISSAVITDIKTGNWIPNNNLDFAALQSGTEGALDGNASANRTVFTNISLSSSGSLAPGEFIALKWVKSGTFSPGLAIDDFVFSLAPITVIVNPGNFGATPVSVSEIALSWQLNSNSNAVLLAWSSDGTFGATPNTQVPGQTINGGGTVLYFGSNTSFSHEDLTAGTTYYYKIWSFDGSAYSSGAYAQAKTNSLPATTTLPYQENFDDDLGKCLVYSVLGDTKFWVYNSTSLAASMNGHNSGVAEEDWLILPGINLNNYVNEVMTFSSWWNYGSDDDDNYLKLMYSTDYPGTGSPAPASWINLTFTKPPAADAWTPSGNIDLSAINGTMVYIAFKYRYEVGNYRWWQIDNISITGDPSGTGGRGALSELIRIIPNPVTGPVTILLPVSNSEVRIYDMLGNLIFHTTTDQKSITIDLGSKSRGVYIVEVTSVDGTLTGRTRLVLQ